MPWQLHEITEDKVARPMKVINNFLDDLLQDALAKKIQSQREISGDDDTLLSHLVKQSNGIMRQIDKQIRISHATISRSEDDQGRNS